MAKSLVLGPFLIQMLLNFDRESRNTRQALSGYFYDDDPSDIDSEIFGFEKRRKLTAESKNYRVFGAIFNSLFLQERFLLPFLNLEFRFVLNSADLFLHTNQKKKFRYEVVQAKLHTTYVKVVSSTKLEIEKTLATRDARYHFRNPLVRVYSIPSHAIDFEATSVFLNSKVPQLLCCALVKTKELHGNMQSTCFNYRDYGVRNVRLSIDGTSYPTFKGINVDMTSEIGKVEGYLSLCHHMLLSNSGILPTLSNYSDGYAIYLFDMGQYVSFDYDHQQKLRSGSGRINLTFSDTSKNENLSLIIFTLTDEVISISSDRLVSKGYVS